MKVTAFTLSLLFSTLLFADEVISSETRDIGHGFELQKTTEIKSPSTEQSKHRYLYHKGKKLAEIDKYSISPSGSYVAYMGAPAGDLYLFSKSDGKITRLTKQFIAPVKKFSWNETFEVLEVSFSGKAADKSFALE